MGGFFFLFGNCVELDKLSNDSGIINKMSSYTIKPMPKNKQAQKTSSRNGEKILMHAENMVHQEKLELWRKTIEKSENNSCHSITYCISTASFCFNRIVQDVIIHGL